MSGILRKVGTVRYKSGDMKLYLCVFFRDPAGNPKYNIY